MFVCRLAGKGLEIAKKLLYCVSRLVFPCLQHVFSLFRFENQKLLNFTEMGGCGGKRAADWFPAKQGKK
jgi:hypothetical protein